MDAVDWDTWLLKPGMPPIEMPFDMTLSNECVSLAKKWDNSRNGHVDFEVAAFHKFTTGQKIVFLETLSDW